MCMKIPHDNLCTHAYYSILIYQFIYGKNRVHHERLVPKVHVCKLQYYYYIYGKNRVHHERLVPKVHVCKLQYY